MNGSFGWEGIFTNGMLGRRFGIFRYLPRGFCFGDFNGTAMDIQHFFLGRVFFFFSLVAGSVYLVHFRLTHPSRSWCPAYQRMCVYLLAMLRLVCSRLLATRFGAL